MAGFDRNEDGRIVYDVVKGVRMLGESTRQETRRWSESAAGTWGGVLLPTGSRLLREQVTIRTIEPMLRKADTDGDGIVSRAELLQLLRTYDADGTGRLSKHEYERALGELGSVVVDTKKRTVGVDIPKPRPVPASAPAPVQASAPKPAPARPTSRTPEPPTIPAPADPLAPSPAPVPVGATR